MILTKQEQRNYNIVYETYKLLFAASTPSADFDKLCKNCKYEDYNGNIVETPGYLTDDELHTYHYKRVIPFMDYEIDKDVAIKIVKAQCKKYKLNDIERDGLNHNIWLGCFPKFKDEEKALNIKFFPK